MTYRDMTFCYAPECSNFKTCWRALTEEVETKAKRAGLPICQFINPKTLDCYKYEDTTDSDNKTAS